MMHIKIHTKGIKGSGMVEEGETPAVMFGATLEIDGNLLPTCDRIDVRFEEGFATVTAQMQPASIEIVSHTKESWPFMDAAIEETFKQRDGQGKLVAKTK
jgi:hypothetical protein